MKGCGKSTLFSSLGSVLFINKVLKGRHGTASSDTNLLRLLLRVVLYIIDPRPWSAAWLGWWRWHQCAMVQCCQNQIRGYEIINRWRSGLRPRWDMNIARLVPCSARTLGKLTSNNNTLVELKTSLTIRGPQDESRFEKWVNGARSRLGWLNSWQETVEILFPIIFVGRSGGLIIPRHSIA